MILLDKFLAFVPQLGVYNRKYFEHIAQLELPIGYIWGISCNISNTAVEGSGEQILELSTRTLLCIELNVIVPWTEHALKFVVND